MHSRTDCFLDRPSHAYDKLPLADNVCELMFSDEFKPDWMITHNIDPAELKTFTSPKKLEQLIAKGVIKIGDALVVAECCLEHDHDHGSSNVLKLATVSNNYPAYLTSHSPTGFCTDHELGQERIPESAHRTRTGCPLGTEGLPWPHQHRQGFQRT